MRRQRSSAIAQDIKSYYGNPQPCVHKYVYCYVASERIIINLYALYSTGPGMRTFQVLDLIDKLNPLNGSYPIY
jgi:hypothetical protein